MGGRRVLVGGLIITEVVGFWMAGRLMGLGAVLECVSLLCSRGGLRTPISMYRFDPTMI